MAKTARVVQQPVAAKLNIKATYKVGGVEKTLSEMLAVKAGCGQQRYVLLDESKGEPVGTLVDKLNPLTLILSVEAEAVAHERKRKREGHRYETRKVLELR